jgi:hypothetical protein
VRVDFDPGYVAPRHTPFGEEIIYREAFARAFVDVDGC